jgi:hypothetical protein
MKPAVPDTPKNNVINYNVYNSKCQLSADPRLGTTGSKGILAKRLVDRRVQRSVIDGRSELFESDADTLGLEERSDGCHLSDSDAKPHAERWFKILSKLPSWMRHFTSLITDQSY